MSKVFTITEGLENMGALKTGGQGSIYKAKRIGPIITAVKLLPTPILSEDLADKNFRDFRNEVEKLKKVNELPNPNIVRILNFGISETGSFPFIEMEFIEGPDLEELLKSPHDPIFTIKETIRVAENLAHALAHCHRMDVKHGDIKSNNVKFNVHTGNYVLLDFGLALMSDEQRRTSLRHAGAVEFMAPEQSQGQLLFESDVYSYGVILYELLAGRVPFLLENRNETTRNLVLVAHMETAPPEILSLRNAHLPTVWPEERQKHEMQVPQWLLDMIRKCMEKDPAKRFANGVEVYEYILNHSTAISESSELTDMLQEENKRLREENILLQSRLKAAPAQGSIVQPTTFAQAAYTERPPAGSNRKWLLPVAAATVAALVVLFFVVNGNNRSVGTAAQNDTTVTAALDVQNSKPVPEPGNIDEKRGSVDTIYYQAPRRDSMGQVSEDDEPVDGTAGTDENGNAEQDAPPLHMPKGRYEVNSARAYFHNEADPETRREAYLVPSDGAMTVIDEQGDFVYVVFTNDQQQTSKGWVLKRDLKPVE